MIHVLVVINLFMAILMGWLATTIEVREGKVAGAMITLIFALNFIIMWKVALS